MTAPVDKHYCLLCRQMTTPCGHSDIRNMFCIAGSVCDRKEAMRANADDPEVCQWLATAKIGDIFPGGGELCVRIS